MKRLAGVLLLCALSLAACEKSPPDEVVVYAPTGFADRAGDWLAESGFAITLITASSSSITDQVIDKSDAPRADVLVTSNAMDIWRAADVGALRPIEAKAIEELPGPLKDPDGAWAAIGYRVFAIGVGKGADASLVSSLRDLAAPAMAGQLCLSSFSVPANTALVGMLIQELGVKPAERLVRNLVRNLAMPPFLDEAELRAALESGDCAFGIVSVSPSGEESLATISLQPAYVHIDGVGISRHAVNAEAAQRLVNWMLANADLGEPGDSVAFNAGVAGWRAEEARLLAERAGYR